MAKGYGWYAGNMLIMITKGRMEWLYFKFVALFKPTGHSDLTLKNARVGHTSDVECLSHRSPLMTTANISSL